VNQIEVVGCCAIGGSEQQVAPEQHCLIYPFAILLAGGGNRSDVEL
jgi:hypothetical protein